MKKTHLILVFVLFAKNTSASDYIEYNQLVNKIDEIILTGQVQESLPFLDTLNDKYKFIFSRHCIKALQICNSANDEPRCRIWLYRSILAGVPEWYFRTLPGIKNIFRFEACRRQFNEFDSLHQVYQSRINIKLSRFMDSLFEIDQFRTHRINDGFVPLRYTVYGLQWLHNNKKQWNAIRKIIATYGFPGEQLLGLPPAYEDSSKQYKNGHFMFTQFDEYRVYFMLIHCYSGKMPTLDPYLKQAVLSGNLPAYQYAAINDFMSEYGYKKYGHNYYNEWHTDPDKNREPDINSRRLVLGMSSLDLKNRVDSVITKRIRSGTYFDCIFLE